MLGKGLESLIPPQGQNGNNNVNAAGQNPEPEKQAARPGNFSGSDPESSPAPQNFAPPSFFEPKKSEPAINNFGKSAPRTFAKQYDAIYHIEVEKIRPNQHQPRKNFDEESIRELALSIREFGILQPLVVTKVEQEVESGTKIEYELIAGERRWQAAKYLGLERVPAIVRNIDLERERLEMAIIENLQREDLSPIEMARAFSRLQDEFRLTQREIATRLGKSREVVANTVRLLDLPPYVQEAIGKKLISESHGRLLLSVEDPIAQQSLFNDLVDRHMSTRELRLKVDASKKKKEQVPIDINPEFRMLEEKLSSELGAPVKVQPVGDGGKITINFYSKEELESILNKLKKESENL